MVASDDLPAGDPDAQPVLVYMTAGSLDEAELVGRKLVDERLAACVNLLPRMVSIYRWEDAVHRAEEFVVLAKTRRGLAEALCARVSELHSYDVPCAVVLPIEGGLPDYLAWLSAQTG